LSATLVILPRGCGDMERKVQTDGLVRRSDVNCADL
jgi:hypothetical protein